MATKFGRAGTAVFAQVDIATSRAEEKSLHDLEPKSCKHEGNKLSNSGKSSLVKTSSSYGSWKSGVAESEEECVVLSSKHSPTTSSAAGVMRMHNHYNDFEDTSTTSPLSRPLSGNRSNTPVRESSKPNVLPAKRGSVTNEQLLAQLEVLKLQNKLLNSKIEKTQTDSLNQLEHERKQREQLVQKLESEKLALNQQLLQAQRQAEQQFWEQKEEFMKSLREMEAEKKKLAEEIEAKENFVKKEQQLISLQRAELMDHMGSLEEEKQSLISKFRENEQRAEQANEAMAKQLAEERASLQQALERMEKERDSLSSALTETEQKAKESVENAQKQVLHDRDHMQARLRDMELEKRELANKLTEAEATAKSSAQAVDEQLQQSQEKAKAKLTNLENEQSQLLQKISGESAAADAEAEAKGLPSPGKPTAKSDAEMRAIQEKLDAMTREKEELRQQLQQAEEVGKQRELEMQEQLAKEKDELKKAVQRMKDEIMAERKLSSAARLTKNGSRPGSMKSLPFVSSQKSLFDLLGESGPSTAGTGKYGIIVGTGTGSSPQQVSAVKHLVPHTVDKIEEGDEKTFMDASDDEDDEPSGLKVTSEEKSVPNLDMTPKSGKSGKSGKNKEASKKLKAQLLALKEKKSQGEHKPLTPPPADVRAAAKLVTENKTGEQNLHRKEGSKAETSAPESMETTTTTSSEEAKLTAAEEAERSAEEQELSNMPAPHSAAALGDVKRLQQLDQLDRSLLLSFDNIERMPLFYAAAYGRLEAIKYLLSVFLSGEKSQASQIFRPDLHGDTPIHAAASSGDVDCLEVILAAAVSVSLDVARDFGDWGESQLATVDYVLEKQAQFDVRIFATVADVRNKMLLTPAHLASSGGCLEKLLHYGADLTAFDANMRSPLFIACAMNREDCAEYLVSYLDATTYNMQEGLLSKDKRGDTPLHASACNGSVECLLLLLQYGIDPRLTNDQGLKAIDLAVKNRHPRCKEILAQYHLHYCTSSQFDSVLFLATLEGHRFIMARTNSHEFDAAADGKTKPEAASYTIIQRCSSESPKGEKEGSNPFGEKGKQLEKATQSMFSLRASKSMRLERWGKWIAYHDSQTKTVFWYDHENNHGQWEQPEQVAVMKNTVEHKDIFDKTLNAKRSMRLKREGDWLKYVTETGKAFYYNDKDGSFQWEDPAVDKNGESRSKDSADWKPFVDQASGSVFWYNQRTNVSQWECPLSQPAGISEEQLDSLMLDIPKTRDICEDNEVTQVLHESDLGI